MIEVPEHEISALREQNVNVAHMVGIRLNQFVDDGVLSSSDLSHAPAAAFEEFVLRYTLKELKGEKLTAQDNAKIQSLFHSEHSPSPVHEYKPDEVFTAARAVLEQMKLYNVNLAGFIVYGSSIDTGKISRGGEFPTDVDVIAVRRKGDRNPQSTWELGLHSDDPTFLEDAIIEDIQYFVKFAIAHRNLQIFRDLPLTVSGVYEMPEFTDALNRMGKSSTDWAQRLAALQPWASNAHAVRFISADPKTEAQLQSRLQRNVNSRNMNMARVELLASIKHLLVT